MDHQIEYARAFKKDILVDLTCTGGIIGLKGAGLAHMKIEEDVTQGTVHVGELLISPQVPDKSPGKRSEIEPIVTIDENYVGNFKIKKDMSINVPKSSFSSSSDWLPCCMGGFFDMQKFEQTVYSAKAGIFDCTCRSTALSTYKPAWNGTVAQFPTVQYQKKP